MKMKALWHPAALLFLVVILAQGPAAASGAQEFGARAYGMGGAYTAVADDIASLIYNPAGLTANSFEIALGIGSNDLNELSKFQSILQEEYPDDLHLTLITLGGMSLGRFGAGIAANGSARAAHDCEGSATFCAEADYMIRLLLGAGIHAAGLPLDLADLNVGASVARLDGRRLTHTRIDHGATYTGETVDQRGKGYAVNLGATFKATEIMTIGLVAENVVSSITWTGTRTEGVYSRADDEPINPPITITLPGEKERLPAVYRGGIAVEPPMLGATLAADIASDGTLRYGIEKSLLFNRLALRAGQVIQDGVTTTTAGLGIHLGPVHVDIAAGSSDGFKSVNTMLEGSVRF